jgi:hypothetical protein
MSNQVVREEFSFTFHECDRDSLDNAGKSTQLLILSRDISKLMEVYGDSKCRIYLKQQEQSKK